ncbi:MAG TPA: NnrU family protein [Stellaceae bacterium]|nr:NnrU family protein [Stellaceae bacterium]
MALLIVAALVWLGIHFGVAGTRLRGAIASRTGEGLFRSLFSVLTIAAIGFLVWAFRAAPTTALWYAPLWLRWVLTLAMLPALVLLVASVSGRNPTMVGGETASPAPVRGIQRITRHPMLWSFALWAAVHILGNGDSAALVFFGTFLVTALAGMPSIDAKLAHRDPQAWQPLAAATSILPFAAIAQGRNHFVAGEIGWLTPLVGVALWAALLYLHQWLFGLAPIIL